MRQTKYGKWHIVSGMLLVISLASCGGQSRQAPPASRGQVAQATQASTLAAPTPTPDPAATPLAKDASASRVETHTFQSQALGRTMSYMAFVPPGYDSSSDQRYPVLYMLHGIYAGINEWQVYGLLDHADRKMRAGEIKPFMIVLPEGEASYWVNHANGGPRWGDYTAQDLPAEIDGRFRTEATAQNRAVGGLSMGGHGALQLGINYPGVFGIVGAHAPTFRSQGGMPDFFGDAAHWAAHDPRPLYQAQPDVAKRLIIWIDIGNRDEWLRPTEALHKQMEQAGIPHTWKVFTGEHHDSYWTAYGPEYLRFYNDAFLKAG